MVLRSIEDIGLDQSEAIRRALITTASRSAQRRAMAAELLELDDDPNDLAERRELAEFLSPDRPSGGVFAAFAEQDLLGDGGDVFALGGEHLSDGEAARAGDVVAGEVVQVPHV